MTADAFIDTLQLAVFTGAMVAAPAIGFGLLAGVSVSIFQATTQINDFSLVFVPKVLATVLAIVLFGSWMVQYYVDYTRRVIMTLPASIG
jgi:flagellar biosynthetic protein FliQ